jgi:hypothetical protein
MMLYKGQFTEKVVEFTFHKSGLPRAPVPGPRPPAHCAVITVPHSVTKQKLLFLLKLCYEQTFITRSLGERSKYGNLAY